VASDPGLRARGRRALAALAWTALILWGSGGEWSAAETRSRLLPWLEWLLPWAAPQTLEGLHWVARKTGHALAYGVLAGLWSWSLGGWRLALGLSLATAFLDELRQATVPAREGSVADLLLDAAGAGATLACWRGGAAAVSRLTAALLWLGAVGGVIALALQLAAGLPWTWLWLTTPAAWAALCWIRRRRGGPPGRDLRA
jgi:hypothetical protein